MKIDVSMKINVLYIEDEDISFKAIKKRAKIKAPGKINFVRAKDGDAALHEYQKDVFYGLIFDLRVPVKKGEDTEPTGGIEIFRNIFKTQQFKKIQPLVFFFSAVPESIERALGVSEENDYILEENIVRKSKDGMQYIIDTLLKISDDPNFPHKFKYHRQYKDLLNVYKRYDCQDNGNNFLNLCELHADEAVPIDLWASQYNSCLEKTILMLADKIYKPASFLTKDELAKKRVYKYDNITKKPGTTLEVSSYLNTILQKGKISKVEHQVLYTSWVMSNSIKHYYERTSKKETKKITKKQLDRLNTESFKKITFHSLLMLLERLTKN